MAITESRISSPPKTPLFIRSASAMILNYSSFAFSILVWLQPTSFAATPVVARRESTTSCFLSDSDESGCACSPEPIEEDSCGVSNTTVCYEECYDIFQLCFDPCLEFQEVCGDSCLINAIYGDAFTSLVCTCNCLGNAYDCYNLCASDFNTCACGCGSVNVPTLSPGIDRNGSSSGTSGSSGSSTSGSFLGHAAAIRTLMAAGLAVVLWYM